MNAKPADNSAPPQNDVELWSGNSNVVALGPAVRVHVQDLAPAGKQVALVAYQDSGPRLVLETSRARERTSVDHHASTALNPTGGDQDAKGGRFDDLTNAPKRDCRQDLLPGSHAPRELDETLTPSQALKMRAQLRNREKIIRQWRDGWRAAARAFMEIRDLRLYRADGYCDFATYCKERLHAAKSTVNRQIAIAEVYRVVASTGAKVLPSSERQMRPLLCLRKPQQEPAVWGKAVARVWVKAVNDAEITEKKLTQKSVLLALKQLGLDPKPKDSQPEADLEKRWTRLEALLEHEKEFWLGEHLHELRVRIVGMVSGWADGQRRPSELDEAPAPKGSGIAAEQLQADESAAPKTQEPGQRAPRRRFANWEQLNWRLQNRDLAAIWHLPAHNIRMMRYRKIRVAAKKANTEQYRQELEEERAKAKASGQSSTTDETQPIRATHQ